MERQEEEQKKKKEMKKRKNLKKKRKREAEQLIGQHVWLQTLIERMFLFSMIFKPWGAHEGLFLGTIYANSINYQISIKLKNLDENTCLNFHQARTNNTNKKRKKPQI